MVRVAIRVGMHQAKTSFSKLVEQARAGEEVIVERSGVAVARIVAHDDQPSVPLSSLSGVWRGSLKIHGDFDELPDDIARSLGVID